MGAETLQLHPRGQWFIIYSVNNEAEFFNIRIMETEILLWILDTINKDIK